MTTGTSSAGEYRSRQKRVGDALRQDTRNRLLEAAEAEFAARGYAGTTVTRLAAAAGVSVQTLYLAWGSKRALLRGYMEQALAGGTSSPAEAARRFSDDMPPGRRLDELANLVLLDLDAEWTVRQDGFRSRSANSWLLGRTLVGAVVKTVADGRVVFDA